MPVEYYRSLDPLENLKLRVFVREISRPKYYTSKNEQIEPMYQHDRTLGWQEKLFSPAEIADYVLNGSNNKGSASQIEMRSVLSRYEKKGFKAKDMLAPIMVYTYIDRDNFDETFDIIDGAEREPPSQFIGDKPYKIMRICLGTDINIDGLLSEKYNDFKYHYKEHLLCSIKIYQDGLLEISPSFSKILEEPAGKLPPDLAIQYTNTLNPTASTSAVRSLSLFMSDNTVDAGIKKGFLISTFRLRSNSGSEFEYAIYNSKDVLIPKKLEEIYQKEKMNDTLKATENRGIETTNSWKQDPTKLDKTITMYTEIVSACNYEGDQLFLTYEVHTPHGWELRKGNLTDGDEKDLLGNFGYDLKDYFGILNGSTQTSNQSNLGDLYYSFSKQRISYQGNFVLRKLSTMNRILLGSFFLITCLLTVVLGVDTPFWIIPVITIYFICANGNPSLQVMRVLRNIQTKSYDILNKAKPIQSQTYILEGEETIPTVAFFNHLLNFSYDVKTLSQDQLGLVPTASNPIIFFKVYSTGLFNRSVLEGCGYFILPTIPGMFDIEVQTWKPMGGIYTQMEEFFIGNYVTLRDDNFTNIINYVDPILNKFGNLTKSSGKVRIRGQIIVTDPKFAAKSKEDEAASKPPQSTKSTRSVADIIKNYKSNQIRDKAAASRGLSSRPSIRSILETINANAQASKPSTGPQDILNKIREKKLIQNLQRKENNNNTTTPTTKPIEAVEAEMVPLISKTPSMDSKDPNNETLGLSEKRDLLSHLRQPGHNRYPDENKNETIQEEEQEDNNRNETLESDENSPLLKK